MSRIHWYVNFDRLRPVSGKDCHSLQWLRLRGVRAWMHQLLAQFLALSKKLCDDEASASHEACCINAGVDQSDMTCDMSKEIHVRHERYSREVQEKEAWELATRTLLYSTSGACNVWTRSVVLSSLHYHLSPLSLNFSFASMLAEHQEPKQVERCHKLWAASWSKGCPIDEMVRKARATSQDWRDHQNALK